MNLGLIFAILTEVLFAFSFADRNLLHAPLIYHSSP